MEKYKPISGYHWAFMWGAFLIRNGIFSDQVVMNVLSEYFFEKVVDKA